MGEDKGSEYAVYLGDWVCVSDNNVHYWSQVSKPKKQSIIDKCVCFIRSVLQRLHMKGN